MDQKARPLIAVKNLTMTFGGLVALEGINLEIPEGQILGLIGPNGAGKTTLVNCITGLYKPTGGDIIFDGQPLLGMRPHRICRMGIGRTFQIPRPFMDMTALENVQVCVQQSQVDFKFLLDIAGLWEKRDKLAKTLTFQERRLLELSRALAVKPKLLLLDETVAGLNPAETAEMMVLLRKIHTEFKLTILWIEHVMKAIMENAHHIVVLHQCKLIAKGDPKKIANDPKVIEAYLGEEYRFSEE